MEIARLSYGSDWPLAEVFGAALMAAGVGRVPRDELPLDQLAPDSVLFGPWRAAEPLAPREHPEPVDATGAGRHAQTRWRVPARRSPATSSARRRWTCWRRSPARSTRAII